MNHIEETIKQLEAKRDQVISLIAGLKEFSTGGETPGAIVVPPLPAVATRNPDPLVNITNTKPKRKYLDVSAKKKTVEAKPVRAAKSSEAKTPGAATPPLKTFASLDKPESLGAAMKLLIRTHPKFTGTELRDLLLADAHTKALLEAGSPGLVQANLSYWAKQGHLNKAGDDSPLESSYTIGNKEFFGL